MNETVPLMRRDLEFFPVIHEGQQLILIRDHLGLVQEGKAVGVQLYQTMILLDGTRTLRDLQMELMRQRGGVLVGMDEVNSLLANLDESFLLDSETYRIARDQIVAAFTSKSVRPCSHCGRAYPADPLELKNRLDEILASHPPPPKPNGSIKAIISPHIDLSVGYEAYSCAYQVLKNTEPARVILLGVGHQMANGLFCLTDKDLEIPLGVIKSDSSPIQELRETGGDIIAPNDFAHRSEHSIEFQAIFLGYLFPEKAFTIIPILCGSIQSNLPDYSRDAYLARAGPFLSKLREILDEPDKETILIAGVDFSHIGPKFGHEMPAERQKSQSEIHDRNLLACLSRLDAENFWEESRSVEDQFNVCGFSALACLLEVLPPCSGTILNYHVWHEEATRSAVSYAAMVFSS